MSSWVALNVEPDEAVEEEVDDTKELQIEEALKLYHGALKLHSQGPEYYAQAADAYDALLNSEIFKYPESVSEFQRSAFDDAQAQQISDEVAPESIAEYNGTDSASSLFQVLYLSYKNHGKFVLDSVLNSMQRTLPSPETEQEAQTKLKEASTTALRSFGDALERDDSDLNLWRQSARLSSALNSYRLSRYCLESVLADDNNRLELRSEQLGIEEIFAEQRLRSTLQSLFDQMSACQMPDQRPKRALLKYLKQHEDPYPNLPALPADLCDLDLSKHPLALCTSRREIAPSAPTWEAVGKALLQALDEEDNASLAAVPTKPIGIILPARSSQAPITPIQNEEDTEMVMDAVELGSKDDNEDGNVAMVETTENDAKSDQGAPEPTKEPSEPGEEESTCDQSAEKQLIESLERQSTQPQDKQTEQDGTQTEEVDTNSATDARKRSSASAVNDEPEGGRMKSRRTRARESNADGLAPLEEVAFDQEKYYGDRLEVFINADDWMFSTVDSLFSKVGIDALGSIEGLREKCSQIDSTERPQDIELRLFQDLRGLIKTWDDEKSRSMQQKDEISPLKDIRGTSKSGLAVFLEHSRKGARKPSVEEELPCGEQLYNFSNAINSSWLHPHQTSFEWLKCLLMPEFGQETPDWTTAKSSYVTYLWPRELKKTVVGILVREDEFIYQTCKKSIASLEARVLSFGNEAGFEYMANDLYEFEMIQNIYELHLDIFASVDSLGSEAAQGTVLAQRDRLARWGMLARSSIDHFLDHGPSGECQTNLTLRHLWASAFHINLAGDAQREHVLLCLQDLKRILKSLGDPNVNLVNNATMSELSAAVIDQEVLKLKCMDFFAKVFNSDSEDPVSLIEAIEPILEPASVEHAETPTGNDMNHPTSHLAEMAAFLDRGDATLRLFLWRRLQEAYQAIDYPPKVLSCYLRSIEVVMTELEALKHNEETSNTRQVALLGWLKALDGIVAKSIPLVLEESDQAFDCLDMEHIRTSMSAIARLTRLLHSFILYEDSVRNARALRSLLDFTILPFVDAVAQNKELFVDPNEDRIHFLRSVHNALGVRTMCRYSQKKFLRLLKAELFGLESKGDYEFDMCQLLLDLHGIKFSAFDGTVDHGCPSEKLDRPTAIMMIDFVLQQANKMNMKDLSKSELKTTIEKMQQAIGPAKASSQTPQFTFNRRLVNAYLKAALNPSNLLRAIQGITELSTTVVPTENGKIAAKGWFFLLGHAALTKFRSQKRLSPGPTTELDDAIGFFRQDLDHGTGRWETWYRLAQAYDSKLDEDITWTADKINNNRSDLAALQRNAIHCYAMAVSTATRTAEPTAETSGLMADLYSDFGLRLYSSSREPLSMGAFSVADFPRHFSSEESQQMYKGMPFKEMSLYSAWNFASNLLKRATADKSKRWMAHYTLGKCLWKMYSSKDALRTTSKAVEVQEIINALLDAIAALPQRRDSRSEPIFEPHFKLLSVVHKLVSRGKMTPAEGSKTLLATPWARKIDAPESIEGWNSYILEVIRKFKSADKSNWHHRMGVKAAHIIYDDQQNATTALAAKQELSQIFTKTLTIQVWRPEFERPGRHFVYTTRYVYFFVNLLDQLDDRASLDQLLRRVRKKQGDFLNHTKLWEDICLTYAKVSKLHYQIDQPSQIQTHITLQLIRRAANITEGHEESIFKPIGWEEFSTKTARLESLPQLAPDSQSILELLHDALELKKLNNNLMKITMFEDLIADLYARLYEINTPALVEQATDENKEKMKLDNLLMTGEAETTNTPPATDTPAPRGRTKGIARRDIQKRADTIVNMKLAPRAVASKAPAAETDPSTPTQAGLGDVAAAAPGPVSALRGEDKEGGSGEQTGDEEEMSEIDETKIGDEGASVLFPAVTDAEEGVDEGDEGDEGDGGDGDEEEDGQNEGEGEDGDENENEGDDNGEGEGDVEGEDEGNEDEDEEMQDEEPSLEEDDKEEKDVATADQSAKDTETEVVTGKQDDVMDITP
ncbi:Tetratricopeptide-like helical [Penicillium bovifimosum]|uniref:Histone transcription regulator 3 homolog n=1 Tax=Penicillium bovifimosum TaxID=126998 RepID=A0A9W9GUV9_9EURO|nr:Tetratricopeptide-like helical [Penicillium bovifimosum]KAJ5130462.1 Tetratricopeptide-like helical [Penicillium bovifimosum]